MFCFGRGNEEHVNACNQYSLEELGNEKREYSGVGEYSPIISATASCLSQVSGICATLWPLCFSFPA